MFFDKFLRDDVFLVGMIESMEVFRVRDVWFLKVQFFDDKSCKYVVSNNNYC